MAVAVPPLAVCPRATGAADAADAEAGAADAEVTFGVVPPPPRRRPLGRRRDCWRRRRGRESIQRATTGWALDRAMAMAAACSAFLLLDLSHDMQGHRWMQIGHTHSPGLCFTSSSETWSTRGRGVWGLVGEGLSAPGRVGRPRGQTSKREGRQRWQRRCFSPKGHATVDLRSGRQGAHARICAGVCAGPVVRKGAAGTAGVGLVPHP